MKRKLVCALLIGMTISMTGCAVNLPFGNKEPETPQLTEEQQALIGTYTEDGALIVGFDEYGWMITEAPDISVATTQSLGVTSKDLLAQKTSYSQMVVTTYDASGKTVGCVYYVVDSSNKSAVKYLYDYNQIGMTYYDNAANKGYTNPNLEEWRESKNEKLDAIIPFINTDKFTETSFSADGLYIYVEGELDRTAIDNTVLMQEVYRQFPRVKEIQLFAMYDKETHDLFRMELSINEDDIHYKMSAVPSNESQFVGIPEYAKHEKTQEEVIREGFTNMPMDAWLWSALYMTDNSELATRDYIINEYGFIASSLEKEYKDIDLEAFLQMMCDVDNDMTVGEFITEYTSKEGTFDTIEQKATYTIMFNRLQELENTMEPEAFGKLITKPEEVVLTEEQQALIGTETEDGKIIVGFDAEGNPITEEKQIEEPQEPEYTIMKATTTVNKRKGPGTNYDKDGQVQAGEEVRVLGQSEEKADWSKCTDADGNIFYIKSQYLK